MKKTFKVVLALIMATSILLSFASCSFGSDDTDETSTTEYSTSLTVRPSNTAQVIAYFNSLLNKAVTAPDDDKPVIEWSESISVSDSSIKITKDGADEDDDTLASINALAPMIKNFILEEVPKNRNGSTEGENAISHTDILYGEGSLSPYDTAFATCIEENSDVLDTYRIIIRFNSEYNPLQETSNIGKAFDLRTKDEIFENFENEKIKSYFELNDFDLQYTNSKIEVSIDRLTDEIDSITYIKNIDVVAPASFKNNFESIGDVDILFSLTNTRTYTFTWPLDEEL